MSVQPVEHDEQAITLRTGDQVAVMDGLNTHIATVTIERGMLILTNEAGQHLRIIVSE